MNEWYIHYGVPGASPFPTNDTTVGIDATFSFGLNSDLPQIGDINGDGRADVVAIRDDGSLFDWYVSQAQAGPTPYPNNTATVLVSVLRSTTMEQTRLCQLSVTGTNDGDDNIGVVDEGTSPSTWYLDTNGGGAFEISLQYGLAGDQYIVGSWPNAYGMVEQEQAIGLTRIIGVITHCQLPRRISSSISQALADD